MSATRRRIRARMIFSPRAASATSRSRVRSGEMTIASQSVIASASTSAGRPDRTSTSPMNWPSPSVTIGARCPSPSLRMRVTEPETSTISPGPCSPAVESRSPLAYRRTSPNRRKRCISVGVNFGNLCSLRASIVDMAPPIVPGEPLLRSTRGFLVAALRRVRPSAPPRSNEPGGPAPLGLFPRPVELTPRP